MQNLLTTWLHTLDHIPQYFDFNTGEFTDERLTKARFYTFIQKEDKAIRSTLKFYYPNLETNELSFITVILSINSDREFLFNPKHIEKVNLSTKVYKFEVTDVSDSSIISFIIRTEGEGISTGTSDTDIDLVDIIIKKEAWNGYNFVVGDVIYLGTTFHDSVIVDLCAKAVAAKILEQTYASDTSATSADARLLRDQVKTSLNSLLDSDSPNLLSISRYEPDLSPIGLGYNIDEYGNDDTNYKDDDFIFRSDFL